MKISKNILAFDLSIQTLIIGFALTSVAFEVIFPGSLIYYLILQLVLGFWQVLSAIGIAILTGNKKRLQYLVAVAAFFINAGLISYFWKDYLFEYKIAMIVIWVAMPVVYALWYFKMTYRDYMSFRNSNRLNDSFYEPIIDPKDFV